ncbi:MAG TPA: rod shape-determining protein MreC [Longimicrobiales bacterium]|nr:rod shape-determining protein MreC [Longimicrobiales bacterium]
MLDFDGTRRTRRRDAALSGAVLLVAFILLALPDDYQRPIRHALRSTVLRPFLALQSQVTQRRGSAVDVTVLRAQRDSLAAVVAAQASLSEENRQLRAALSLSGRIADGYKPANLLRVGLTSAESTFVIDAGSSDGVFPGSPVLTADGLLGVVVEVDDASAQAIDWTHPDFRVSAMTADGLAYGIVEPRRGQHREEDLLALTGSPFQVDIRPGRRVVSSGRGGLFPRGVMVGTVIGIEEADTGWRKSYLVRPSVRPEGVVHVLVGIREGVDDLSEAWQVSAPPDPVPPDSPDGGGGS